MRRLRTKRFGLYRASFHAPSRPPSSFAEDLNRPSAHEETQVVACIFSHSQASRPHQPSGALSTTAPDRYSSSAVAKPDAASGIAQHRSPAAMHISKGVIAAANRNDASSGHLLAQIVSRTASNKYPSASHAFAHMIPNTIAHIFQYDRART